MTTAKNQRLIESGKEGAEAAKGKDYLGKILPMVDVRTGPYKEEPRMPLESLKARVQKAVDRAMDCVGKRAYDSTLMDEMYIIQRDEKDRLPGMTVKRSGFEIDATRAICEMQECMLRLIGPIHPW
jgi:hypothetical protein